MPLEKEYLNLVYEELVRLSQDKNLFASVLSAVEDVYLRVEAAVSEAAGAANLAFECQRGCCLCCPPNVGVELFEILPLVASLNEGPTEVFADALEAAQREDTVGPGRISFAKMFLETSKEMPHCFLLDEEKACGIYNQRPLACRLHVSTSVAVCRQEKRPQFTPKFAADLDSRVKKIVDDFAASGHHLLTGLGGTMYRMLTYNPQQRRFGLNFFGQEIIFTRP